MCFYHLPRRQEMALELPYIGESSTQDGAPNHIGNLVYNFNNWYVHIFGPDTLW